MSRLAFIGLIGLAWAQNVGIGTSNPQYRLDVVGRARIQQQGTQTAGIWFYQTTPNADRAFVGMANDDYVGFWGNAGANWGMVMNVANGMWV
ncbi:MAG: hypothetical protein NZ958_00815 [Bacteroidia bacterium]|nr:hypothetical protein [Bacteroidia bacterium]